MFTSPTNIYEVCHFLGMTGYYHKFIPLHADIAKPLNNLLCKKAPFVWSEEHQSCFKQLKEPLCNPPILQHPDPAKSYVLFHDVSNYALAGVLIQAHENSEELIPIAYTSGSFSSVQQHWCATEKECLAIYQSILKFDFYLWESTCTVKCDHKPLEPFLTSGMKIQKIDRWTLEILDYNLTFVHIEGSDNILADTISWLQSKNLYHKLLPDPKTLYCEDISLVITKHPNADSLITTELLIEEQKKDEQCRTLAAEFHKPRHSKNKHFANLDEKWYVVLISNNTWLTL